MDELTSRLNVLDFVITVLGQHEKSMDDILAKFEDMLTRLENFHTTEASRLPRMNDPTQVSHQTGVVSDQPFTPNTQVNTYLPRTHQEHPLTQIELVILNLTDKGNSPTEIALRLDMNPHTVKQIVAGLVVKGCLTDNKKDMLGK